MGVVAWIAAGAAVLGGGVMVALRVIRARAHRRIVDRRLEQIRKDGQR